MTVEKTRCSGQWTESRYRSFVVSQLRRASMRWGPINEVKKAAWLRRGFYLCAQCLGEAPTTLDPLEKGGKRIKNVYVDHIDPVVDPAIGWVSFDYFIERLYCEREGFQVLCRTCHDIKSGEEREVAVVRRRKEKLIEQ